ncbi:MAG: crossover junction endodeoxyribonuclease RuvC [Clostridia bacterium]|nr:crossover junction endodeoxyribonuclease RuvC [Clostridia bacterium]
MIILGIDPGFGITGFGVIDYTGNKFKVIDYGVVSTDKSELFSSRLKSIFDTLSFIIDKYHPECMAIEELFFNNNAKTAIMAAHGRGVAMLACTEKDIPIFEYTPLQVKQNVVGYGRADKRQVQEMVKMILNLKTIPRPDDAADALAIAICHAHSLLSAERV